jgi:RimJ/RimL family protein N-acetyltransferase
VNSVAEAGSVRGVDVLTDRFVLHPVDREEARRIRDQEPGPSDEWAPDYPFEGDVTALTALLRVTEDGRDPRPFGYYQLRVNGRAVGGIGFFGPPTEGTVEIGYGLAPSARGHGYAAEAVIAIVRLAAKLDVRTVQARTETDNTASRRTLERAGFVETRVEEGTHHFETVVPGPE